MHARKACAYIIGGINLQSRASVGMKAELARNWAGKAEAADRCRNVAEKTSAKLQHMPGERNPGTLERFGSVGSPLLECGQAQDAGV